MINTRSRSGALLAAWASAFPRSSCRPYISEIAPAARRGRLVALYQFQIVLGILVAFASNYLLALALRPRLALDAGRSGAAGRGLPAAGPASAREPALAAAAKGRRGRGAGACGQVDATTVDQTIAEIRHAQREFTQDRLFVRAYLRPILLAFLIAAFNQLSGINFIIYFAPRIFGLAGLDSASSLLSSAGIGLVNLVFTLVGVYLIDRAGRRNFDAGGIDRLHRVAGRRGVRIPRAGGRLARGCVRVPVHRLARGRAGGGHDDLHVGNLA